MRWVGFRVRTLYLTMQYLNRYVASYKKICAEFGIDPSTDFRLHMGKTMG